MKVEKGNNNFKPNNFENENNKKIQINQLKIQFLKNDDEIKKQKN